MRKSTFIAMLVAALVLAFALPAVYAVDAPKGAKDVKLPAGFKMTQAQVQFNHDTHKMDCKDCHHTWDGKAAITGCQADGCHTKAEKKGADSYYVAFHDMKSKHSCMGCHKTEKAAGKKVPTTCVECHPKKS